jgi:5S rRNA maturation endonuclease (ribonuclease M5)
VQPRRGFVVGIREEEIEGRVLDLRELLPHEVPLPQLRNPGIVVRHDQHLAVAGDAARRAELAARAQPQVGRLAVALRKLVPDEDLPGARGGGHQPPPVRGHADVLAVIRKCMSWDIGRESLEFVDHRLEVCQGDPIAYCGRSVDQIQPRYRVPPGFAKSEILFNMHRAAATGESAVVVVEGFFDCMKLRQAGIQSVVALMGSALYELQRCALFGRFRHVVVMLDGDVTGRKAGKTVAGRLRPHCTVQVVELPLGTQPDQLSMEAVRGILQPTLQRRLAVW